LPVDQPLTTAAVMALPNDVKSALSFITPRLKEYDADDTCTTINVVPIDVGAPLGADRLTDKIYRLGDTLYLLSMSATKTYCVPAEDVRDGKYRVPKLSWKQTLAEIQSSSSSSLLTQEPNDAVAKTVKFVQGALNTDQRAEVEGKRLLVVSWDVDKMAADRPEEVTNNPVDWSGLAVARLDNGEIVLIATCLTEYLNTGQKTVTCVDWDEDEKRVATE
jgi:hypothetical protein